MLIITMVRIINIYNNKHLLHMYNVPGTVLKTFCATSHLIFTVTKGKSSKYDTWHQAGTQ